MNLHDITSEAVKSAPPVAITLSLGSIELDTWVKLLTILYITLQIIVLIVKAIRKKDTADDE